MSEVMDRIERVKMRICRACDRAGRPEASVRLLAVSKKKPADAVEQAWQGGLCFFGENRVQEAAEKIPLTPSGTAWHLIGHLQSNKAKLAANLFDMIQSVDSIKLIEALNRHAQQTLPMLLQVNIAGEGAKFGFSPHEVAEAIRYANSTAHCEVHGLMLIPPFTPNPEEARAYFKALRLLRDEVSEKTETPLPELSMGMSNDLEVAIEEGSTWVRVGTDIFGERA